LNSKKVFQIKKFRAAISGWLLAFLQGKIFDWSFSTGEKKTISFNTARQNPGRASIQSIIHSIIQSFIYSITKKNARQSGHSGQIEP